MSWRRILLLSIVFVALLAATTWIGLQRSDAATGIVRRELAARLATPASLQSTELDLGLGRLTLRGLRMEDPTRAGSPLLQLETAHVEIDINPLGSLGSVHGIDLEGLTIELGPTMPRLDQLIARELLERQAGSVSSMPPIRLRRARLLATTRALSPPWEVADLQLDVMPIVGKPGHAVLKGTGTLVDLAATLHLDGQIDLASGAVAITAALRDWSFDSNTLAQVMQRLALDLHGLDVGATIRELTVQYRTMEATAPGPRQHDVEVRGTLAGVRAEAPWLPRQIRHADVGFTASNKDDGEVRFELRQQNESGQLALVAGIEHLAATPSWSVRATGRNVGVDIDAVDALRLFPLGHELMAALRPTAGRADIDIYLRDAERAVGVAEFEMTLRDVAMAYHGFGQGNDQIGFPLPLVNASGKVRLRDNLVVLEGLAAAIDPAAGGGAVLLDGQIDTTAPTGEDTTLDIRATNVRFNQHLRQAVMALLHDDGELYDRLSPTGEAAVEVSVRPQHVLEGGWSLRVLPQRATMLWGGFPYRLDGLTGTVLARQRGVEFDLAGVHGEGRLSLRGRIPLSPSSPGGIGGFESVAELHDIEIDEDLRKGLAVCAPALDEAWRESRPTGRFDGKVRVWRPSPRDPLHHDLDLDLASVTIELPSAPWRATGLRGRVHAEGSGDATRLDFDALRGRLDHGSGQPAQLAMLGTLSSGAIVTDELAFVVRGLELDEQLGSSLAELGALGTGTWAALRPSGTVDLVCRHSRAADSSQQLRLVVELVDVTSNAPMLPKPAQHMTGELEVGSGIVTFHDVRADIGGSLVRCHSGRVRSLPDADPRTEVEFTVSATGFQVDEGLANMFSGPLQQAIKQRELQGRADVDELKLRFLVPTAAGQGEFETEVAGQLRLYDLAMALGSGSDGIRVTELSGVVGLEPSRVGSTGGELRGTLRRGSLRVFGQPFDSLETSFVAAADHLAMGTLSGRLHGGQLRTGSKAVSALHYTLPGAEAPAGRLSADLQFEKVDVSDFLRECGWANPPYSGLASGEVQLDHLDGYDVVDASGSGRLSIENGDLGPVPLFTAIYSQLPAPERPRFHGLSTDFRLQDRRLDLAELSLRSNLLGAHGRGSLELDGYLDVRLQLDNLLGSAADPLLMPFVDFLTKNIVRFHLFGHLRDLHAEKRWVTERAPGRSRILPMPPILERPALPPY